MNRLTKVLARMGLAITLAAFVRMPVMSAPVDTQLGSQADQTANAGSVIGNTLTSAQVQVSSWVATASAAMNVWYTGPSTAAFINIATGGGSGTSNNCITFFAPYNVIDTTVGGPTCSQTSGGIDLGVSTSSSLGQVCDIINSAQAGNIASNYHCKLLGGIRADPASVFLATTTETAGINPLTQTGGFNILFATNTVMSLGITPAPNRRVVLEQCQINSGNTDVYVYGRKRGFSNGFDGQGNTAYDSTIAWAQSPLTAATLGYVPNQYSVYPWLEFAPNIGNVSTVLTSSAGSAGQYRPYQTPQGNSTYDGHVVVRSGGYSSSSAYAPNTTARSLSCTWSEK